MGLVSPQHASRLAPNAPIPGRGLPADACNVIPTPQLRLARACGLFGTSLVAAGTLALGPAVVIAKLGAGVPVVVDLSVAAPHVSLPSAVPARGPLGRWLLKPPRPDWRAGSPLVVAGTAGAPRGRVRALAVTPRGEGLSGVAAAARLAVRRSGRRPARRASLALSRRQRPPPGWGRHAPNRSVALIAHEPATPPSSWWCGPLFLSSRV